jgi:hypothetical protein
MQIDYIDQHLNTSQLLPMMMMMMIVLIVLMMIIVVAKAIVCFDCEQVPVRPTKQSQSTKQPKKQRKRLSILVMRNHQRSKTDVDCEFDIFVKTIKFTILSLDFDDELFCDNDDDDNDKGDDEFDDDKEEEDCCWIGVGGGATTHERPKASDFYNRN